MRWDPLHWCRGYNSCCKLNRQLLEREDEYLYYARYARTNTGGETRFGHEYGGASGCEWWRSCYFEELRRPSSLKERDCGLCIVCMNREPLVIRVGERLQSLGQCCFPQSAHAYKRWYRERQVEFFGVRLSRSGMDDVVGHVLRVAPSVALRVRTISRTLRASVENHGWSDEHRFNLYTAAVRNAGGAMVAREINRWSKMSYRNLTRRFSRTTRAELAFFGVDDAVLERLWGHEQTSRVDNAVAIAVAQVINQSCYVEDLKRALSASTDSPRVLQARKILYVDVLAYFDRHVR